MKKVNSDILHELWLGNICPKYDNPDGTVKDKFSKDIDYLHFEIAEKLDGELFDKFIQYEQCYGRYVTEAEETAFKKGFSLAIKLMTDAYIQK